jgi:hypothetical protein
MKSGNEIADAYEAAFTSGTADSVAVEQALATWRSHFPDASEYDARRGVALIIAERRIKMRKEGKLPGGGGQTDGRQVADKNE